MTIHKHLLRELKNKSIIAEQQIQNLSSENENLGSKIVVHMSVLLSLVNIVCSPCKRRYVQNMTKFIELIKCEAQIRLLDVFIIKNCAGE